MKAFIDWRGNRPQYAVFKWRKSVSQGGGYETLTPEVRITSAAEAKRYLSQLNTKLAAAQLPTNRLRLSPGSVSLATLASSWGDSHLHRGYRDLVTGFVERFAEQSGIRTPDELSPAVVMAWRSSAGPTDKHNARYLATVLRWSVRKLKITVDPETLTELCASASYPESTHQLMTDDQYRDTMERAEVKGQYALAHCLSTYGWRPITLARIVCGDFNPAMRSIRLTVKGHDAPFTHPLFPLTVSLLRTLTDDRPAGAPVFLSPTGLPWLSHGTAERLISWYVKYIRAAAPDTGGIYAWKRWAITVMHQGHAPWARPLTIPEIQLFTGHRTKLQLLRYLRTSMSEARALIDATVGSAGDAGSAGSNSGSVSLLTTAQGGMDAGQK